MKRPFYTTFAWAYDRLIQKPVNDHIDFIAAQLGKHKIANDARLLDAGCGTGNYALALSEKGFRVTGLDISKDMLAQAQELPSNVNLILGDAEQLCLINDSMDLVYYLTSLEFINDIEKTLKETKRAIKPGGGAIFIIANVESWFIQKELKESDSYLKRKYENIDSEKLEGIIGNQR